MTNKTESPLEIDDLIVLLLGSPTKVPRLQNRIDGITRLEKLVFLLERELPTIETFMSESAEFEAYNFGPFSSKIYQAIETLAAAQIVDESTEFSGSDDDTWETESVIGLDEPYAYSERRFELTDRGRRYFAALKKELPDGLVEQVGAFKERFGALPLRQLVRYVYERYEDYAERSLIRDEILGP